jgi:hypothetical protein
MSLTQEQIQRLKDWLSTYQPKCSTCGHGSFTAQGVSILPTFENGKVRPTSGPGVVPLVCARCETMMLVTTKQLGIF